MVRKKSTKTKTTKQSKTKETSVNRNKFLNFLEMLSLQRSNLNREVLMDIQSESIFAILITQDKNLAMRGWLYGQFEEAGKVGVCNLPQLLKYAKALDMDFDFKVKRNKLILTTPKSKLTTTLQNAEIIKNSLEETKFDSLLNDIKGESFTLTKEQINDISKKIDLIGAVSLILSNNKGKMSVIYSNAQVEKPMDETELEQIIDIEINKNFTIKFDEQIGYFRDILTSIDSDVQFTVDVNEPKILHIIKKDEETSFEYLIALSQAEDEEEETETSSEPEPQEVTVPETKDELDSIDLDEDFPE